MEMRQKIKAAYKYRCPLQVVICHSEPLRGEELFQQDMISLNSAKKSKSLENFTELNHLVTCY